MAHSQHRPSADLARVVMAMGIRWFVSEWFPVRGVSIWRRGVLVWPIQGNFDPDHDRFLAVS